MYVVDMGELSSFVNVQEIFADPCVEGVTEAQCNLLPYR